MAGLDAKDSEELQFLTWHPQTAQPTAPLAELLRGVKLGQPVRFPLVMRVSLPTGKREQKGWPWASLRGARGLSSGGTPCPAVLSTEPGQGPRGLPSGFLAVSLRHPRTLALRLSAHFPQQKQGLQIQEGRLRRQICSQCQLGTGLPGLLHRPLHQAPPLLLLSRTPKRGEGAPGVPPTEPTKARAVPVCSKSRSTASGPRPQTSCP